MTSPNETIKHALESPEYAKAIGIVLVVFGHALRGLIAADVIVSTPFWETVDKAIYLFHMPLFFYLSGLFIKDNFDRRGGVNLIKRYAALLLIPLIIWSYLQFSLQYIAASAVNNPLDLNDVLFAPFPPRQQFWFLGALFLSVVAVAIIFKLRASQILLSGFLGLYALASCFYHEGALVSWMSQNAWLSLLGHTYLHVPYFVLGILVTPELVRRAKLGSVLCVLIFFASLIAYLSFDGMPDIVRFTASILCVLTLYKFLDSFAEKNTEGCISKILIFIGLNSMIIYLAHVIASAGTRAILLKAGIDDPLIHLSLGTTVGILAPLTLVLPSLYIGQRLSFFPKYIVPAKTRRI